MKPNSAHLLKLAPAALAAAMLAASIAQAQTTTARSDTTTGAPVTTAPARTDADTRRDFTALDKNKDGFVSREEAKSNRGLTAAFGEADANKDGKLNQDEHAKAMSMSDRAAAGAYAQDSFITAKVKAALMKDTGLEALDVNVETHKGEVMLAGFVETDAQRQKAVQIAKSIEGVKTVHDKMAVKK